MAAAAVRENSRDSRSAGRSKKVPARHLRMATVLLLGVALTAAGWFSLNSALLDAGLLVTAAGVVYGIYQLVLRGADRDA